MVFCGSIAVPGQRHFTPAYWLYIPRRVVIGSRATKYLERKLFQAVGDSGSALISGSTSHDDSQVCCWATIIP